MKQVRRIREDRGLKQKELAALVGVRPATICNIEKGKATPHLDTLKKIAHALDVSIETLINAA